MEETYAKYLQDLLLGNGIIIILGCFIVGMFLKGTVKVIPNKYIPYVNALVAIALGFLIPGTYEDVPIVSKIIILAFLGLSSVGLYESICTLVKKRFSIDLKKIYNNIVNGYEEEKDDESKVEQQESSIQPQEDVPQRDDDIDIDIH